MHRVVTKECSPRCQISTAASGGGRGAAGASETISAPSDTKTHGAGGPRAVHTPGRRRFTGLYLVSGAMKAVKAKSPLSTLDLLVKLFENPTG